MTRAIRCGKCHSLYSFEDSEKHLEYHRRETNYKFVVVFILTMLLIAIILK